MNNNNKISQISKKGLNFVTNAKHKIRSSIHQGAQVLVSLFGLLSLGLLTSQLFIHSAYAAFYVDVSSTSSVKLTESGSADGGSIKPSGSGTLGTGSDVVTVNTNCTAGYNLYVSATSTGSTNLNLSGASSSELQDAANYIAPSSNAPTSEGALTKDTWGVGKTNSTFAGLQAYSADAGTWTPLYTATDTDISDSMANSSTPGVATLTHNVYYGANISTAKNPGTYTGNVLYTVLMNNTCTEYTLKFDDGIDDSDTEAEATITNNLPNGIPTTETGGKGEYPKVKFGTSVDLSEYSSAEDIKRTGYYLSGWKVKIGSSEPSSTVYTTTDNIVLDDGEASEVTLIAQWEPNKYTIHYNANPPSGKTASGSTADQTDQAYDSTTTLRANGFSITGYHVTGWAYTASGTKAFDSAQANVSIKTLAENAKPSSVVDENNATINLYAIWAANTYYIDYNANGGSGTTTRTTATYDQNVTLRANSFTAPTGKKFKSWGTTTSGGTTYSGGQTLTKPNFTATDGGSYTLYAIWEDDAKYFQTASVCSTISVGTTATLKDNRDNQDYTVYRFPNTGTAGTNYPTGMAGYCLMTKDLSLGYVTGGSITKGANLSLSTSTSASSGTITARTGTSDWSTTNSDSNLQYINGTNATYGAHSYYSYGAAQKVCPKGWRPPTKAEYDNIKTFMGGNNSTGSSTIRSAPYNFVYGGGFNSGGWSYVGSDGYYWSSTQYDSSYGYRLYFNSSNLSTGYNYKYAGRSVRCVASS